MVSLPLLPRPHRAAHSALGGEGGPTDLEGMFGDKQTLVVYTYMYGPQRERPCPMCTSLLSAWDVAPSASPRTAFRSILIHHLLRSCGAGAPRHQGTNTRSSRSTWSRIGVARRAYSALVRARSSFATRVSNPAALRRIEP